MRARQKTVLIFYIFSFYFICRKEGTVTHISRHVIRFLVGCEMDSSREGGANQERGGASVLDICQFSRE